MKKLKFFKAIAKKFLNKDGTLLVEALVGMAIMGLTLVTFLMLVLSSDSLYRKSFEISLMDQQLLVEIEEREFTSGTGITTTDSAVVYLGEKDVAGSDYNSISMYITIDGNTVKGVSGAPLSSGSAISTALQLSDGFSPWFYNVNVMEYRKISDDSESYSRFFQIERTP